MMRAGLILPALAVVPALVLPALAAPALITKAKPRVEQVVPDLPLLAATPFFSGMRRPPISWVGTTPASGGVQTVGVHANTAANNDFGIFAGGHFDTTLDLTWTDATDLTDTTAFGEIEMSVASKILTGSGNTGSIVSTTADRLRSAVWRNASRIVSATAFSSGQATTSVTIPAQTSADPTAWGVWLIYFPFSTGAVVTPPSGLTNRASATGSGVIYVYDTAAGFSSYAGSTMVITTARSYLSIGLVIR